MTVYELIKKKRDGLSLSMAEFRYLIQGYTKGIIPDYQMSALLMAVYFRGMDAKETHALTTAMLESGSKLDLSAIPGIKVDKHSSGGVADTVTLAVAPIAAAAGIPIAKMSGKGLGHTGGTIDKLESIPGFRTDFSAPQFLELVRNNGLAVVAQGAELVPADKKMYALRDVTATVDSIPLIAASIMSKKLAAGADAIVLDVKTGSGAFMKDVAQAKKLAQMMLDIGKSAGKNMLAYVTDMNQPLGNAIGNALEIEEGIAILQGKGPHRLRELVLKIAAGMLMVGGKADSLAKGEHIAAMLLDSGAALAKFQEFVVAQGGDPRLCQEPNILPRAAVQKTICAPKDGYLVSIASEGLGMVAVKLGAGRMVKDAQIDYSAGLILHQHLGDFVKKGDELCTLYSSNEAKIANTWEECLLAFGFQQQPIPQPPLIYEILA